MSEQVAEAGPADEAGILARREWLELFFDLVVVAGIAVLSESLSEASDWGEVGLFVILFGALWFTWAAITSYSDVAGTLTRAQTMLAAMLGVAVMAAANPLHSPERANVFAVAFLIVRGLAARGTLTSGRLLTTWSGLQGGGAIVVWIASLWVPEPAKYVVWGVAITLDLVLSFVPRRSPGPEFAGRQQRGSERRPPTDWTLTELDPEHVRERLGLFFIIVLGEIVSRIVLTATAAEWTLTFGALALLAFVLVTALFREVFLSGFAGLPREQSLQVAPALTLGGHLGSTLGIVVMAAGIGRIVADPTGHPDLLTRGLACGGLLLYLLVSGVLGLIGRAPGRWLARPLLGSLALTVTLLLGGGLPPVALVAILAACLLGLGVGRADRRRPSPDDGAGPAATPAPRGAPTS